MSAALIARRKNRVKEARGVRGKRGGTVAPTEISMARVSNGLREKRMCEVDVSFSGNS